MSSDLGPVGGPGATSGTTGTSNAAGANAPTPKGDTNTKYASLGAMGAEHPEVIEALKKTLSLKMMNDLKHDEDHRKQRVREEKRIMGG
jgi:hypothetical protein